MEITAITTPLNTVLVIVGYLEKMAWEKKIELLMAARVWITKHWTKEKVPGRTRIVHLLEFKDDKWN